MTSSDSLKAAENALRDLFNFILRSKLGDNWVENCGVTNNRILQWQNRQQEDHRKFGSCDPRLIYYADFYDLKTILKKNWQNGLSEIFGNLKETEVFFDILADLRNPDAHRRELLPYQSQLAEGISGKLRTNISGFLSTMETRDAYYSKIESIQDSLGNTWAIGDRNPYETKCMLRVGDTLQFQVSGSDPLSDEIEFGLFPLTEHRKVQWNKSGSFELTFENEHVNQRLWIFVAVKSPREFHATSEFGLGKIDDVVKFSYEVLPPRNLG